MLNINGSAVNEAQLSDKILHHGVIPVRINPKMAALFICPVDTEGADPLLASEVVSKLQEMPRWKPAFQNGRTVKVKYTLPISFTLHS